MLRRLPLILLAIVGMGIVAFGVGIWLSTQNAANASVPVITPVASPPPASPALTQDIPVYNADQVVGITKQRPEIKNLYDAAEKSKDWAFPEVRDINVTANYIGQGQWRVVAYYQQLNLNTGAYENKAFYYIFVESAATEIPVSQ